MLMKKYVAVLVLTAILVHVVVVALIPHLVMSAYFAKVESAGVEVNRVYHNPPINASFRNVVLPSPDLLYSYCIYDLSKGNVLVRAEVPEGTYWSASFYDSATNNFFTLNDTQVEKEARILLVKELDQIKDVDATVVKAKSEKGLILFRIFIPDENLIPYLDKVRRNSSCQVI